MYQGVSYILLSNIFMIMLGCSVKSVPSVAFYHLVFYRAFIGTAICLVIMRGNKIPLWGNNRKLLFLRGVTGAGAIIIYYLTLQVLPLALAVSLQYLSPLFTVLFTLMFTKTSPNKTQIIALFGSLIGTFMIYNLTQDNLSIYAGLAVISAMLAGASYANIGILKNTENTIVILFYFSFITLITVTPYSILHFKYLTSTELFFATCAALSSFPAQICLTRAYQLSSAYIIAPLTYLNIVFASIAGYIFWQETISSKMYLGICLIVGCNILMLKSPLKNTPQQ